MSQVHLKSWQVHLKSWHTSLPIFIIKNDDSITLSTVHFSFFFKFLHFRFFLFFLRFFLFLFPFLFIFLFLFLFFFFVSGAQNLIFLGLISSRFLIISSKIFRAVSGGHFEASFFLFFVFFFFYQMLEDSGHVKYTITSQTLHYIAL